MATSEHISWADSQLMKIENKTNEQKRLAAERFDKLHEEGSARFGKLWLQCNMILAELRDVEYVSEDDRRIDALISECAWKMAEHIESLK